MSQPLDRPLAGVKVVALEQAVSMPFCSFMLSELGADVIKLERYGRGDLIREWDSAARGLSTGFVWVNANKRDAVINLGVPRGKELVHELVNQADVFLENNAPGAAGRLGLDHEALTASNPRLIYCSLSGYGQTGPYRDVKAYDLLVQGESGILLSNGQPDAPAKIGLPITDLIAGSNAAIGVVSALLQRQTTGRGCYLDVSMLDSAVPWLGYYPHRYWHAGEEPPRSGMRHQYLSPYGPYLAADERYVNIVIASQEHWKRFCLDVIDRPEWLTDERLGTISSRQANREFVEAQVEEVILTRRSDDWVALLAESGLPYGLVRNIGDVVTHPQLIDRELFVEASSPVGVLPIARFPLAPQDEPRHIPALGEHTDAVLRELGYGDSAIEELRAAGVVA